MAEKSLTELLRMLRVSDSEEKDRQTFAMALEKFKVYINKMPEIGIYIYDSANFGHQANSIQIIKDIVARTNYSGKVWIISNDWEQTLKIQTLLPFFDVHPDRRHEEFNYLSCKMQWITDEEAVEKRLSLVFCGGYDTNEQITKILNCLHFLCIQPYGWKGTFGNIKSFYERNGGQEESRRYVLDGLLTGFSDLFFRYDVPAVRVIPQYVQQWYSQEISDENIRSAAARFQLLHAAPNQPRLWPIYGLHVHPDRAGLVTLMLALSALRFLKYSPSADCQRPIIMVLFNYRTLEYDCLRLFREFVENPAKWAYEWCKSMYGFDYGSDIEEQQPLIKHFVNIFVDPLNQLLRELNPSSRLENLHLLSSTQPLPALQNGHLYVYPLGAVPMDYFNYIFASGEMPLFFEGQATSSLAYNLGVPFFQKSLNTSSNNYPTYQNLEFSQYMNNLCEGFARTPRDYYNRESLYVPSITKISDFLISHYRDHYEVSTAYFHGLSITAQDPMKDKLSASLLLFGLIKRGDIDQIRTTNASPLDTLHANLLKNLTGGTLDLTAALPGSSFIQYTALITGGGVTVKAEEKNITAEQKDGKTVAVAVQNAKFTLADNEFTASLRFDCWEDTETVCTTMECRADELSVFDGIPWLEFENPGFRISTIEALMPMSGALIGKLKQIDLDVEADLIPTGGVRRIRGEFETPKTAMDAFHALAGGVDFIGSMPEPLRSLGGFGVKSAELHYNEEASEISFMAFTLTTKTPWQFIDSLDITVTPAVTIQIINPQDLSGRKIWFEIAGDVTLGDAGALRLVGSYPPFNLSLYMTSEKMDLTKLLAVFGIHFDLKSALTDLSFEVCPDAGSYNFSCALESDWELIPSVFTATGLGLQVSKTPESTDVTIMGSMVLLPDSAALALGVRAEYTGGAWSITARASIGGSVTMGDLVSGYGGDALALPAANDGADDPELGILTFSCAMKSGDWSIAAETKKDWYISVLDLSVGGKASLGRKGGKWYGLVQADIEWHGISLAVWYDYRQDAGQSFRFRWEKLEGAIISEGGKVTGKLSLSDFSFGEMIETMVGWAVGTPFGLEAPWDFLNDIKLNCTLTYNFSKESDDLSPKVEFSVKLGTPLKMGFATVEGITVSYGPKQDGTRGVMVSLDGEFVWNIGDKAMGDKNKLGPWDAAKPGSAPSPGGQGNKYFDLRLLALGQHVDVLPPNPNKVETVMNALAGLTPPEGDKMPAISYGGDKGWLVGADFGILREKDGGPYFINLQAVFADPDLYALRLRLDGTAAKIFKGLDFEILYRKISETIGMYKAEITLPDYMRYLTIGAYSLTLPVFGIEIYTNGDFKIDIGFPWNHDFSRSFAIEGIIPPGIPVTGAGGLYFGKLSAATAGNCVPQTDKGLFNPVIVFGFGLRIGLGKSIRYGVLSGGFSLTIFGILEGVIAKWNPYQPSLPSANAAGDEWYYSITGSVGISGQIFGSIDFAVIKISVNLSISLYVDFSFESYRPTTLAIAAKIEASASIKIDLWLFSIEISFHFSVTVRESLTFGKTEHAPWDSFNTLDGTLPYGYMALPSTRSANGVNLNFSNLKPGGVKTDLCAYLTLPLTAARDEWGSGNTLPCASVLLTLKGPGEEGTDTFSSLCRALLQWIAASVLGRNITAEELAQEIFSDEQLAELENALGSQQGGELPIPIAAIDAFLSAWFTVSVAKKPNQTESARQNNGKATGAVFFPVPPAMTVKLPAAPGREAMHYAFGDVSSVSNETLRVLRTAFDELAVKVEQEERDTANVLTEDKTLSMAEWVFCDYFLLLARQGVRALRRGLENLHYTVSGQESPADILAWIRVRRGRSLSDYSFADLFLSNADYPLSAGKNVQTGTESFITTGQGDTLSSVATRAGVSLAALFDEDSGALSHNAALRGLFTAEGGALNLPGLAKFRFDALLKQAESDGVYSTLGGMASRYYLHGMRLPTDGISARCPSMWTKRDGQLYRLPPEAGLFALTGQQFRLPDKFTEPFITSFAGGASWLKIPDGFNLTAIPGSAEAQAIGAISECALAGRLNIPVVFEPDEAVFRPLSVSFAPPGIVDGRPLWTIPAPLIEVLQRKSRAFDPYFKLELSKYDPGSGSMAVRELGGCTLAALTEFTVRRTGTPFTYIPSGAGEPDVRRLEALIDAADSVTGLRLFYIIEGKPQSDSAETAIFDVAQIDLSTETHPPERANNASGRERELLTKLWESLVTNNGGYALTYRAGRGDAIEGLPDRMFNDKGEGKLLLAAILGDTDSVLQSSAPVNAIWGKSAVPAELTLLARAETPPELPKIPLANISPAQLSERYFTDLRSLVHGNPNLPVRQGVKWCAAHAVYQAGAAAPGRVVSDIIKHFGIGSIETLKSVNPKKTDWGSSLAEHELIRLPVLSLTPGAGDTLESFASRFLLDPVNLLWQNKERADLFAENAVVSVPVCPGRRESAVPAGVAGYSLTRISPPVPTGLPWKDYAEALLSGNYSLIRFRVSQSVDYHASIGAVPAGPTDAGGNKWRYKTALPAAALRGGGVYNCADTLLQTEFEWLDHYGNKLLPGSVYGRLCGYTDSLFGLTQWPSLALSWRVEKHGETADFALTFAFDSLGFDGAEGAARAANALVAYERIDTQLRDPNGVTLTLSTGFLAKPVPFSEAQKKTVINWISDVLAFLRAARMGENAKAPTPQIFTFPLDAALRNRDVLFPLDAAVTITRAGFAACGYEELHAVTEVTAALPAPADHAAFAKEIESAFPNLRVLSGDGGESVLWALQTGAAGLTAEFESGEAQVFAPRPISNKLESRDGIRLPVYTPGSGLSEGAVVRYQDVDLNLWLRQILNDLDAALTPETAGAMRLLARVDASMRSYDDFLNQRRAMSDSLCGLLVPVFDSQREDGIEEARECFRQRLLSRLSNFYGVHAVAVRYADVKNAPGFAAGEKPPRFYGALDNSRAAQSPGITLSAPKLSLKNGRMPLVFSVTGSELPRGRDGEILRNLPLMPRYHVTHLERNIRTRFEDFDASSWLSYLTGAPGLDMGEITVPLPIRRFPEIPTLTMQEQMLPKTWQNWQYRFSYSLSEHYPQSAVHCTVHYNESEKALRNSWDNVFEPMARLLAVSGEIVRDMAESAAEITHESALLPDPKGEAAIRLRKAADSLYTLTADLLRTASCNGLALPAAVQDEANGDFLAFQLREGAYSKSGDERPLLTIAVEPSDIKIVPSVLPERYNPVPLSEFDREETAGTWVFRDSDGVYLSAAEGQRVSERFLLLPECELLKYQSARAELFMEQNRGLCPGKEMNPCFIFTTGTISFQTPYFASRTVEETVDLSCYLDKQATIYEHLAAFFTTLMNHGGPYVQAEVRYCSRLMAGLNPIELPVCMQAATPVTQSPPEDMLRAWADTVEGWHAENIGRTWFDSESLRFSITFLSHLTGRPTPILTLRRVILPGEMII